MIRDLFRDTDDLGEPLQGESLWLFLGLLTLIAWLPVPLGSNRPWSWALMEVVAFGLLALWGFGRGLHPRPLPPSLVRLKLPLALLSLWMLYQSALVVPLPLAVLDFLSAPTAEAYRKAQTAGGEVTAALAVDRSAASQVWLKNSAYLSLLLLVLVLVDNPTRLRALALVMIITGLAEGLYGTIVYLAGPEFGLWKPYESGHRVAIGTYVNRNHYSALLSMAICLGLGMVTATFRPRQEYGGWRATLRHWLSFLLEPRALLYMVLMLLFGAFFLGQSRGATLGLLVSLTLVIGLGYWWRGNRGPEARLAPLILLIAVGGAAWLGVGDLAARFFTLFSESSERITTWGWTLEMIWDRPWFGVGGGGYEWAFPAYKGQQLAEAHFDHAHNDYLELLADQGLLGAALLAPAIAMLLWCIGKGFQRRRDPFLRGILFASLAGTLGFLLHAMVDFNFQIPANAAWFHVLLGMGLVAANLRSELDTR